MSDKVNEIKGITIEFHEKGIKFIPEDITDPWWRDHLNRSKDGILCPQILSHMHKILLNLTKVNDVGQRVGKYNIFMTNLQPNPKSSQGKMKTTYKDNLIERFEKSREKLEKFRDKEVFVYIAIFLRPKRYDSHDLDNFLKAIIDSLNEFIGDDSKVVSILTDKIKLIDYPKEDFDFLEQAFIVIGDNLEARSDIHA